MESLCRIDYQWLWIPVILSVGSDEEQTKDRFDKGDRGFELFQLE